MRGIWVALAMGGCGHAAEATGDTGSAQSGACGHLSSIPAITITGRVRDADQNWVEGADLELQERNWSPGSVHGTATTGAGGVFTMDATNMPVLEGCWGTAVQYWLAGTTATLSGDKPMNPLLEDAWNTGATSVDLGDFPLILYP